MYLKIISQSTPPHFAVYFTRSWVCRSTLQHLHSGQISRKLWRAPCRKPFSNTLWDVSKNIFAIRTPYFVVYIPEFGCHIRYGNLILILVKVPQIVTYILQKTFFNMLWKYRKSRKSIINYYYNNKKLRDYIIQSRSFYSALKTYLYFYFN